MLPSCRKWIWIGVAFNLGFFVVTTQISALALARMAAPQRTAIIKRKEDVKMALECAPPRPLPQQLPPVVPNLQWYRAVYQLLLRS